MVGEVVPFAAQVVWVTGASAGFGEALCIALCQVDPRHEQRLAEPGLLG